MNNKIMKDSQMNVFYDKKWGFIKICFRSHIFKSIHQMDVLENNEFIIFEKRC